MNKKMIFGLLLVFIGFPFSIFCFAYAVMNPCIYNGMDGIVADFLGTDTLIPFIIAMSVMCAGVVICFLEAYRSE